MPRLSLDNPGIVAALSLGAGALRGAKQERDTQKAFRRATAQDSYRAGLERIDASYKQSIKENSPEFKLKQENERKRGALLDAQTDDMQARAGERAKAAEEKAKTIEQRLADAEKKAADIKAEKKRKEDIAKAKEKAATAAKEAEEDMIFLFEGAKAGRTDPARLDKHMKKNTFLFETPAYKALVKPFYEGDMPGSFEEQNIEAFGPQEEGIEPTEVGPTAKFNIIDSGRPGPGMESAGAAGAGSEPVSLDSLRTDPRFKGIRDDEIKASAARLGINLLPGGQATPDTTARMDSTAAMGPGSATRVDTTAAMPDSMARLGLESVPPPMDRQMPSMTPSLPMPTANPRLDTNRVSQPGLPNTPAAALDTMATPAAKPVMAAQPAAKVATKTNAKDQELFQQLGIGDVDAAIARSEPYFAEVRPDWVRAMDKKYNGFSVYLKRGDQDPLGLYSVDRGNPNTKKLGIYTMMNIMRDKKKKGADIQLPQNQEALWDSLSREVQNQFLDVGMRLYPYYMDAITRAKPKQIEAFKKRFGTSSK